MWHAVQAKDNEALRRLESLRQGSPDVILCLNDAEPGYASPEYPGGGKYVVRITGEDEVLNKLEQTLFTPALGLRRLR
jgi:hypothetical protein